MVDSAGSGTGSATKAHSTSKRASASSAWRVASVTSSSCTAGQAWWYAASTLGRRLAAVLSIEAMRSRPCGRAGSTAWRASSVMLRMRQA
ncbi:hypothetical protein D3C72_1779500 [compost metagenome]